MVEKPAKQERVKEVPLDPKKLSPIELVTHAIALIAELKNRAGYNKKIKSELSTINIIRAELDHLSSSIAE